MTAIIDAGPLYAAVDRSDRHHAAAISILAASQVQFIVPVLVIAEVSYLIGTRLGPDAEAAFVEGLQDLTVAAPIAADWPRIAELVRAYRSFPLGTADASIVALAERIDCHEIITFDRRHFRAVRPRHVAAFRLRPD
jgi:predicted nucleic acid-binding protein